MADLASIAHHLVVPRLNSGGVEREVDQQALVLYLDREDSTLASEVADVLLADPPRDIATEGVAEGIDLLEQIPDDRALVADMMVEVVLLALGRSRRSRRNGCLRGCGRTSRSVGRRSRCVEDPCEAALE